MGAWMWGQSPDIPTLELTIILDFTFHGYKGYKKNTVGARTGVGEK